MLVGGGGGRGAWISDYLSLRFFLVSEMVNSVCMRTARLGFLGVQYMLFGFTVVPWKLRGLGNLFLV